MTSVLKRITVTFLPKGVEFAVTYAHTDEPPEPALSSSTRGRVAVERRLPCN